MRMVVRAFKDKKLEKDIRSDDEEVLSDDEPQGNKHRKNKTNGTTRRRKDN